MVLHAMPRNLRHNQEMGASLGEQTLVLGRRTSMPSVCILPAFLKLTETKIRKTASGNFFLGIWKMMGICALEILLRHVVDQPDGSCLWINGY